MDRAKGCGRTAGFDAARLAAAGLIFFQHGCSILDRDDWPVVAGLRVGRVGTVTFFALSGYLAAATPQTPEVWLWRRLRKLYPAYWVVLAACFLANAAGGYKSFDEGHVVAQFLGIALFTHSGPLVYTITWFLSALLVSYLLAYLALRNPGVVPLAAAGGVVVALSVNPFSTVAALALPFWVGFVAARAGRFRVVALLAGGAGFAAMSALDPDSRYGAVALPLLAAATFWPGDCRAGRWFAGYAWEWYLVHALCLHAVVRCGGDAPAVLFPAAALLSVGSAVALRHGLAVALARLSGRGVPFRPPAWLVAGVVWGPARLAAPRPTPADAPARRNGPPTPVSDAV